MLFFLKKENIGLQSRYLLTMIINRKTDLFRLTTVASIETVLIIAGILTIITLLVEVSFALYTF
jgi:arginine exporter protein ArgO